MRRVKGEACVSGIASDFCQSPAAGWKTCATAEVHEKATPNGFALRFQTQAAGELG